jgi:hypothetical protein
MTKLPNAAWAIIEQRKLSAYLLNLRHPDGAPKAAFLMRFGFHRDSIAELSAALLRHALMGAVVGRRESDYGVNYTIGGPLPSPDGRNPDVRVVWAIRHGETAPRLVTLIPVKG